MAAEKCKFVNKVRIELKKQKLNKTVYDFDS